MTQNKRIILNVVATYGRTMFSIICGLFTVRWVLMVLGHEDFGIYGVVGSMAIFVGFLNTQLSDTLTRFYAVSIGRMKAADDKQAFLEDCRIWFSCGVLIHLVVPLILISVGYPLGVFALKQGWLTIPTEKLDVCVWLWRFSCISSLVSMVNAPFQAMYTAKQYIAELTTYSFVQTFAKTVFVYLMTIVPGNWLFGYALGICLIAVAPQVLICWRAFYVFPECRLRRSALSDWNRICQIASFAWWKVFGGIGYIARHQCLEIVVNRHFGPKANASYTVAATFGAEAASLTGALNSAFGPVIVSAYGEGRFEYMKKMAMRSCKFGSLLTLMFAIPMFLEANEVLHLWLKNPPENVTPMCMIMVVVAVVEKLTMGHYMAVSAVGGIRGHMFWRGMTCLLAIPFSVLLVRLFPVVMSVPIALLMTTVLVAFTDVYFAKVKASIGIGVWIKSVLVPLLALILVSGVLGGCSVVMFHESFLRVCITTAFTLLGFAFVMWILLLDAEERFYVKEKVLRVWKSVRGGE